MKGKFKNPNYRKLTSVQKKRANGKETQSEFDSYIHKIMENEHKIVSKYQQSYKKEKILAMSLAIGLALTSYVAFGDVKDFVKSDSLAVIPSINVDERNSVVVKRIPGTAKYKVRTETYGDKPYIREFVFGVQNYAPSIISNGIAYDEITLGHSGTALKVEVWALDKNNNVLNHSNHEVKGMRLSSKIDSQK